MCRRSTQVSQRRTETTFISPRPKCKFSKQNGNLFSERREVNLSPSLEGNFRTSLTESNTILQERSKWSGRCPERGGRTIPKTRLLEESRRMWVVGYVKTQDSDEETESRDVVSNGRYKRCIHRHRYRWSCYFRGTVAPEIK